MPKELEITSTPITAKHRGMAVDTGKNAVLLVVPASLIVLFSLTITNFSACPKIPGQAIFLLTSISPHEYVQRRLGGWQQGNGVEPAMGVDTPLS